jgi:TPR repeat protein
MRNLLRLVRVLATMPAYLAFGLVPGAFAQSQFPSELPTGAKPWAREPAVQEAFLKGKNGDAEGAVADFRALAAAGSIQAKGHLANYQIMGRGMKPDVDAGCKAARATYDLGAVNAAIGLIGCLIDGSMAGSRESQNKEALRVATDAWENHRFVPALEYIGLMQEEGIAMKADPAAAERTYRLGFRYQDEMSAYFLGQLLESGKVGKHPPAEITAIYRQAALRLDGPSMIEMAKRLSLRKETLQEALVWAATAEAKHVEGAAPLLSDIRGKLASAGMKFDKKVYDKIRAEILVATLTPMEVP